MSITRRADVGTARAGPRSPAPPARRPWAVWAVPFAVTLGLLVSRNAFLFTAPEYERADMGANSILIEQARRFALLTGNYSRRGFSHPGPAFLYVQAWGESLFWAALRVVPTAWNGQLLAVYALNAWFAAGLVAVAYGWTRSARGALAAGALVAAFGAAHPPAFSSDWMPYVYVLPYLLFVVALASVAAGHRGDAWIAAVSGWFLVHGHAAFLFLVPALAAAPAGLLALRAARRGALAAWLRDLAAARRAWLPAAAVSALFALPLALELAWHGDGNYARYVAYGSSRAAGGHTAAQVARYVLWFWWPGRHAWLAPPLLALAAAGLTARLRPGPARSFCWSLLGCDALATALTVVYTAAGVDDLTQHYIGYFSWAGPAVALLVIVIALAERGPGRGPAALAAAAAVAVSACAALAVAPATRTSTSHVDPLRPQAGDPTDPALPRAVAVMGALAAGRTVVLTFPHDGWQDVTGILVQAGRAGVAACVADRSWAFLVSGPEICTAAERAGGYRMSVYPAGAVPRGARPVARLARAVVTSGPQ